MRRRERVAQMKVMFIHSQCENGGISRIVFSLCDLLEKEGNSGIFAFSRGFVPEGKEKICKMFGSKASVIYHVLMTRFFDLHGHGSKYATKELISIIQHEKPDIIHLNNVHGYYLNIGLFFEFLRETDIPIVWTLHDCWPLTGHCSHFAVVGCDKWKKGCEHCPQKEAYPSSYLIDRSRRNYLEKKELFTSIKNLTIVVPSKWLYSIVRESFFKDKRVVIINNGIDINTFDITDSSIKKEYGLIDKRIILAVASVWTQKKGFDDIIKLSKIIDNEKYAIVVIGVNESQREKLKKNEVLGILHTKDVKELAAWYSAADVFINPTYEDTYPTVNMESIACGTPVVTYNTGGSVETVEKETGRVVKAGDIGALYNAIQNANKKADACRAYARQFDFNLKFSEYINLYEQIVK